MKNIVPQIFNAVGNQTMYDCAMAFDSSNVYGAALAQAKTELAEVRLQLSALNKRQTQLEAFVATTESLLPFQKAAVMPLSVSPIAPSVRDVPTPIWRSILDSINGKAGSFTVNDALEGMKSAGRIIDSPNRSQIVRNVLLTKKDKFTQLRPGVFAVKGREMEVGTEKEAVPVEKTS